ncbi:hypothetical protein GTU99_03700 [Streptomyces sp. PRKS01-65]|nr:hypothetical protein [Streptomyces harenosi]NEY31320.1 hypothetical protein [Streptomyces harenosi]
MTDFWVLLGTDQCGKSTILDRIAARGGPVLPVSYDAPLLSGEYRALTGLPEALRRAFASGHAPEYVQALLNVAVAYYRDRIFRAPPGRTLLIDSYYYKILAKCRLLGLADGPWQEHWRSLPQPRGVLLLEVDPGTAWRRAGEGARLNPFEHYGPTPDIDGFTRFQLDLRAELVAETRQLHIEHVPAGQDVGAAVDHVLRTIEEAS